jgi:hypothetical protein
VPPALWGFGRGFRLGKVGSNWQFQSLCLKGLVGHGRDEWSGRRGKGLVARNWAALATGSKRGLCRPEAVRGDEHHWDGGSAATAS